MPKINRLQLGGFITVACAAVISFNSIEHLAAVAGFGWTSWLFPVVLDVVFGIAVDVWMRRVAGSWQWGAALSVVAIVLSLAANTADHWLTTHTMLAAVMGAVPPLMLAGLLVVFHRHAAAVATKTRRTPARRRSSQKLRSAA